MMKVVVIVALVFLTACGKMEEPLVKESSLNYCISKTNGTAEAIKACGELYK